jgi:hypothetical protein
VGVVANSVKAPRLMDDVPVLDDGADGRLGIGTGRPLRACKETFACALWLWGLEG